MILRSRMVGIEHFLSVKKLKEIDKTNHGIKHIAINLADVHFLEKEFSPKKDLALATTTVKKQLLLRNKLVNECIEMQIKHNVTVMTIFLSYKKDKPEFTDLLYKTMTSFFSELLQNPILEKQDIKVTILGKWYDTSSTLISSIKHVLEKTQDSTSFFLNFCINYDGQEEILDACKVLALKSKLDKIIPNQITEEDLKDNLYISYFIPPDRIVSVNKRKRMLSFLLWDSAFSRIYFIEKHWNELNPKELERYFV